MKSILQIGLFVLLAASACKKHNIPPQVYLPYDFKSFTTEDSIAFDFTATDDRELKEVGYFVTTGFDTIPGILPPWEKVQLFVSSGKTDFRSDTLIIPDSISAGKYRLGVYAMDDDGYKDSLTDEFTISSKVDSAYPVLDTIIAPDSLSVGDELSLSFSFSDDTRLVYGSYRLRSLSNDSTLLEQVYTVPAVKITDSMKLPNLGNYQRVRFEVIFHDWVNNKTSETTDIIIKE